MSLPLSNKITQMERHKITMYFHLYFVSGILNDKKLLYHVFKRAH